MSSKRPLVLVDLDDTLFQTSRKMRVGAMRHTATLDVDGQPNGYMSTVQKAFVEWLLQSADVVPVTARSIEAYRRVQLPFVSGAVCTHGGVILQPDGSLDRGWHGKMTDLLAAYQSRLPALCATTLAIGQDLGLSLRSWVVEEHGLLNYVVTKHNESDDSVLQNVLAEVQELGLLDGVQIHCNGNNLAFLPKGLTKRNAVQELLCRDRVINGERPVLGFGDSVTDLGFMSECNFWATPVNSQLAAIVEALVHD